MMGASSNKDKKFIQKLDSNESIDNLLNSLSSNYVEECIYDIFMDWDIIHELNNDPLIEIGSHIHSHLCLDSLSDQKIIEELSIS